MRILPAVLALATAVPATAADQAAGDPSSATVFVRTIGDVVTEYVQGWKQQKALRDVEIATGSGFIVAASGYVLTNHHVIAGADVPVTSQELDVSDVRVRTEVKRIQVVLPGGEGSGERALSAALVADDPDLDLALLSVEAADLPWLALGDSDALELGQPVTAWGFPLGRAVEVGRAREPTVVPRVAASPGSVAALRGDEGGEARYIQTDVTLNHGNSGGPLVDEDGAVVGVIRMKLVTGDHVGFAIPVNLVKDFLEAHSPTVSPARLRLGSMQAFDWKGLRLRVPEGLGDTAPARVRWSSGGASGDLSLVIDRVASLWTAAKLESQLLAGGFGGGATTPRPRRRAARRDRDRVGTSRSADVEVEYAILDLGNEKLIARFAGPPAAVAYNRGVLRRSLESLEADRLLTAEVAAPVAARLERVPLALPSAPAVLLPAGWTREGLDPPDLPGRPTPDTGAASSPEGDFTVACRAFWWDSANPPPEQSRTYRRREDRLGVVYQTEGFFLPVGGGLLQLEVQSPETKARFVEELLPALATRTP